jgi:excisionase family DNA binding protein
MVAENFLTVDEVAKALRLSRVTICRQIREGSLPAVKIGNKYRIREADFNAFLEKFSNVREQHSQARKSNRRSK